MLFILNLIVVIIQAATIGSVNRHLSSSGPTMIQRFDRITLESEELIETHVPFTNSKIYVSTEFVKAQTPFQFNLNCASVDSARCQLFQRGLDNAGKRIADMLQISQTIIVDVSLSSFDNKELIGSARSSSQFKVNVENEQVLFPQSLLKQLSTNQFQFSKNDIIAKFNTDFDFFFRTTKDAKITKNQIDFELVACHEITHGLGFITGLQQYLSDTGTNSLAPVVQQNSAYMSIFDAFISVKGEKLTQILVPTNSLSSIISSDNTPAEKLYNLATSNNLEFKFKGISIDLYSPKDFNQGSSISHVNQKFQTSEDFLMVPILARGLDMDTITSKFGVYGVYGKKTRAIMNSIGWTTVFDNQSNIALDFSDPQNIRSFSNNVFASSQMKMDVSIFSIVICFICSAFFH